jgi:hypothetical protein
VTETYCLQIVIPEFKATESDLRAFARLPRLLAMVEEDLTDLLPEGWSVQIRPQEARQ